LDIVEMEQFYIDYFWKYWFNDSRNISY